MAIVVVCSCDYHPSTVSEWAKHIYEDDPGHELQHTGEVHVR